MTYTVASLSVRTSPLAVITVVGLLDVLMVSNSAELRSFTGTWENPLICRREECGLVVRFELENMFGKIPSLALGTSLLSFSLFVGPVLKFQSVGTSLMSRFDLYFSNRWSLIFPDTGVTQRGLGDPNSLYCVQEFSASGFPETLSFLKKRVHPSLLIHNPIVTRFSQWPQRLCLHLLFFLGSSPSSAFYLVVHQPCNDETNTCLLTYNRFFF